jgi:predicted SnoaL-like aldol condensation-catalyzing enzyme
MSNNALRQTARRSTQGTSVAADNARLVRRTMTEIWNGGDLDLADHVFAPDYVNHGGLIPDLVCGPEAIKVGVALYRIAFPEVRVAVDDLLAQGPMVALRWAARGTPPAGSGTLCGMTFVRVAGGRIQESWTCWEAGAAREGAIVRDIRTLARRA